MFRIITILYAVETYGGGKGDAINAKDHNNITLSCCFTRCVIMVGHKEGNYRKNYNNWILFLTALKKK